MKKLALLFISLLLLTSCGDDGSQSNGNGLVVQDLAKFTISIPASWEVIEDTNRILPQPSEGSIELAVTAKDLKGGFSNNFLILSDKLNKFSTSKEYSMLNNVWASKEYIGYLELDRRNIVFSDEEEGILYEFEAKYNHDTPKLRFLQTAHICNGTDAYLLTVALSSSITDTAKYEEFIRTFECK